MKKLLTLTAITVALLLVAYPLAYSQGGPPQGERPGVGGAPPAGGPPAGAPPQGDRPGGAPPAGAPPQGDRPGGAPGAGAQAEKTFEGQLAKVDAQAKSISVKGIGGMEMTFNYTDATQVTGSEKTVQGLAGKTGSELKVTYRDQGANHIATKIDVEDKKK